MIAAARRWVTVSCLALLVACGGSGAAVHPGPQSGADLTDSSTPGAGPAEDELDLQPVSAPEGLVVVGRWKNPGQTTDTLMSWSNLPFDWRRLLQARYPELAAAVALDAPVEAAVALDPAGGAGAFPQPFLVVSLGLTSLDRAVDVIRDMGESVRKLGPGVYRIEGEGRIACAMARALGPSPARLVCGERRQDVDALLPYATRGLPSESLPGGDVHLELRVEPLRKRYGRELRQLRSLALPAAVKQLSLGSPQFDRAVAEAVHGLADEGLALLDDFDQVTIDLNAASSAGELDLTVGLRLRFEQSWIAKSVADVAKRAGPAPERFWRLPADSQLASFGISGDPELTHPIRRTLAELLDGYLAYEKVPRPLRGQLARVVEDTWVSQGWVVSAQGAVAAEETLPRNQADRQRAQVRRAVGWHLLGLPDQIGRGKGYLNRLVQIYKSHHLRALLKRELSVDVGELPRVVARPAWGAGIGAGSMQYEITVPAKAFAPDPLGPAKKFNAKPLKLFLMVVPDGDSTWVGLSADRADLLKRLALVSKPGSNGTLAQRGGLVYLKRDPVIRGGYLSVAGLFGGPWGVITQQRGGGLGELIGRLPHRGETPIGVTTTVERGAGTTVKTRLRVPKEVVQDAVAAAVQGEGAFGE